MLGREYEGQVCSAARTLELVGERWTLLILRDAFLGIRRFGEFQESLGVARNVLAARLERLVDEGVMERRRYQERPERFEYRLTEKGIALWPVLIALTQWGDAYTTDDEHGPPMRFLHRGCGGTLDDHLSCDACGERLSPRDIEVRPGPGLEAIPEEQRPLTFRHARLLTTA
jgi:DNA-binding HxlR family transcriptional regulator